jgi:hypothetical protein
MHGWIFANDSSSVVQGVGPDDGHPELISSCRSELGVVRGALYHLSGMLIL